MTAHPVVKWAGGKSKLVTELLKHVPEKIGAYVEPFAGGAALFFALEKARYREVRLSDTNGELVNFYRILRDEVDRLIETLRDPGNGFVYKSENFYMWRSCLPSSLDAVARAARFLYLNRTCFNGLYRVNKAGIFNVPFGRYTNPTICDVVGLRDASMALAGVVLESCDFESSCAAVGHFGRARDLVYFDPPYDPVSATANFTGYAKAGFRWEDQERLAELAARLRKRGAGVIASNTNTERIRKLWGDLHFAIYEVTAARNINSSGEKRGKVSELIMVGG